MNKTQRDDLTKRAQDVARTALSEQATQQQAIERVTAACWEWMKEHNVSFNKENVAFVRKMVEREVRNVYVP